MPLEILLGHIDGLIHQIINLEKAPELNQIPFSKVKNHLISSIGNYRNGLKIIRKGLTEVIIKKAELVSQSQTKHKRFLSVEEIAYKFYRELLSASYVTAERFNTDVTMLVKTGIPPELYHWLLEIPESFGIKTTVALQEGQRFITETFRQKIIKPLKSMIELAKRPEIEGTLAQFKPIDLTKSNPIGNGYVISCVRGEAQNPVLWPILLHEVFELVDNEQNLLKKFREFASMKGKSLPALAADSKANQHWILEILMDFFAINSFGPMYAKSLLEYSKRSPYIQTFEHPEMSSRLFCAYQYVKGPIKGKTDIFGKCQVKARQEVEKEIKRFRVEGEFNSEKEQKLLYLYSLMAQFFETIKVPSFFDRLEKYSEQAGNPKVSLEEALKDEKRRFIPFSDPLLNFNDIRNNIFYHHISLAIDPNIVLNVVLANYDLYRKDKHFRVIVDSIRKWKIKQVWNYSANLLEKNS